MFASHYEALASRVFIQQLSDHVIEAIDRAEAETHQSRLNQLRTAGNVRMFDGTTDDMLRANSEVRRLVEDMVTEVGDGPHLDEIVELARALVRLPPVRMNLGFVLRNLGYVLQ